MKKITEKETDAEGLSSEKKKVTKKDMKKFFNTFLAIFIIGLIIFFVFEPHGFIFSIIGLLLGIVGTVGIIIYLIIPQKIRAFLEKRKKHEELKILSKAGPIISLIGGIITLIVSSVYINQCCGLGEGIGVPFLVIGVISLSGVIICIISKEVGSFILIAVGIPGFYYLIMLLGLPIVIVFIGGVFIGLDVRKERKNKSEK